MNDFLERLDRVALLGVADLLWPQAEYGDLTEDERLTNATRLVKAGNPRASHFYRVCLGIAAEAARVELETALTGLVAPRRRG